MCECLCVRSWCVCVCVKKVLNFYDDSIFTSLTLVSCLWLLLSYCRYHKTRVCVCYFLGKTSCFTFIPQEHTRRTHSVDKHHFCLYFLQSLFRHNFHPLLNVFESYLFFGGYTFFCVWVWPKIKSQFTLKRY